MKNINYLSDFKIKEKTDRVDQSVLFVFLYYVTPTKRYEASFDGSVYKNCYRNEDGTLTVVFDKHGLDPGKLKVERKYYLNYNDFTNGVCIKVSVEDTGINLVTGKTDKLDVEISVIPPYLKGDKGDSLTWESLTEDEKDVLVQELGQEINAELIVTSDTSDTNDYEDLF